jgi:ATP-binding cassette subfamily F protein 3
VLFVSHDRYFIDQLANRIFEIEGGQFRDYAGNYEDYLWQKENRASAAQPQGAVARAALEREPSAKPTEKDKPAKKVNPILVRQMKQRRDHLEDEIARCETEISASEMALATFTSAEETIRITKQLEGHRSRLGELMKEWEHLALTLEETGTANLA